MTKITSLFYKLVCYSCCAAIVFYGFGFLTNSVVPKAIDTNAQPFTASAFVLNFLLLAFIVLLHRAITESHIPKKLTSLFSGEAGPSNSVLVMSLAGAFLFWQWQGISGTLWDVQDSLLGTLLTILSLIGWLWLIGAKLIKQYHSPFALNQVAGLDFLPWQEPSLMTKSEPAPFNPFAQPIKLGFLAVLWATPTMTAGHLLFAAVLSVYCLSKRHC